MPKKERNLVEIGRVVAILLEGISGMIDRLCDRAERKAGIIQQPTPAESTLSSRLTEEYNE